MRMSEQVPGCITGNYVPLTILQHVVLAPFSLPAVVAPANGKTTTGCGCQNLKKNKRKTKAQDLGGIPPTSMYAYKPASQNTRSSPVDTLVVDPAVGNGFCNCMDYPHDLSEPS